MTPTTDPKATEHIQGAPLSPEMDAKSEAVQLFFSDMLSQVEEDFERSGDSIIIRMKNMCSKMDDLEQSISDLMHNSGLGEAEDSKQNEVMDPPMSPVRQPPASPTISGKTTKKIQL